MLMIKKLFKQSEAGIKQYSCGLCAGSIVVLLSCLANIADATVLPEERADVMYHEYDGDGIKIAGPSVLVRKNFLDKVSVNANYYVDKVSSASIDVRTYGSPYHEERTEQTIGLDYLNENTITSLSYTNSSENDYKAETYYLGISQDLFGSMTNIGIGFAIGDDEISKTGEPDFSRKLDRQNFRISVSQILTKKLIMGINFETVTEEGYLQNPYRKSRITFNGQEKYVNESYPHTKSSDAVSLRFKYHLPYRAAVSSEFRYYSDSWGINGRNFEVGYTHPLEAYPVVLSLRYRFYSQNNASFYFDQLEMATQAAYDAVTPDANGAPFLFHGRDKELATYDSNTYGFGVKCVFLKESWHFVDKASVSLNYDYIDFVYEDFREGDTNTFHSGAYNVGEEPLFEFDASVIRLFFTALY